MVVLNKSDYIDKIQEIIDDGIKQGVYEHSSDSTLSDLKNIFCTDILENHSLKCMREWFLLQTNQPNYMELQKLTSSQTYRKFH